ncbi:MAG: hypothetical protein L0H84_20750, partial [Pseudonocardia sp.]|nr:hypothetical protein [Pseudonocardia sp.]
SACSFAYRAEGHARAAGASADASAHATGDTVGGGTALASARAEPGTAQAAAGCTGSAGVDCHHYYAASAADSAHSAGSRARASAAGSGGGGEGRGGVAVVARASAGPGSASASAGCAGAANCRHSYAASAADSASYGGNHARARAAGNGGGGAGSGGVAVTAQASAGPGCAAGAAACAGTANCRYWYSATASDSASYDDGVHRSWANAYASGSSGGSGPGGGGVSANAQASAGKGYASATAGCGGTANCTASYSSHAEATKTVGGQHGEAWSTCSGSGSGGYCGSQAVVEVDADSAFAQAGCAGTGSCASHYATRSAASGSGPGITGDSGGHCSGERASGGYCATGSRAVYDPESGTLKVSSYCGTAGGTCSHWADLDIDAASPDGTLTGTGAVDCSGGVGACGIVGVAKYHPARTGPDGKPVPPTLEIGTGCDKEGSGTCAQWSSSAAKIVSPDGEITATATARCSGTTGWCSTPVAGSFGAETGEILAYTDCAAGGASTCTKSEAHLTGSIAVKGKATPNGPELGTIGGTGRADCVRTSGPCSVYGTFTHLEPEQAYETDEDGEQVLDDHGKPIPVFVPRRVVVATGCFPAGPHCSQEAHLSGDVRQEGAHEKHTGTAKADCAGTSGGCHLAGAVAYDPASGKVAAFTKCTGEGRAACTKSETHTYALAESPDGKLHGDGRSDCVQTTGYCSSVSIAKYVAAHYPKREPCPDVCFQAVPQEIPEHLTTGASCDTDGPAGNC